MPETVDPTTTAYGPFLERSDVPVRRHDPEPVEHVAAAGRRGVGRQGRRQVGRARQRGRLLRAAEHAEPGRLGHDQRPAAADDLREHAASPAVRRADAGVAGRRQPDAAARGPVPALQRRARVRPRLQEPAHLLLQRRLRAGARARLGRLRRLHLDRRHEPDAVPQLQPQRAGLLRRSGRAPATSTPTPARRGARSSAR